MSFKQFYLPGDIRFIFPLASNRSTCRISRWIWISRTVMSIQIIFQRTLHITGASRVPSTSSTLVRMAEWWLWRSAWRGGISLNWATNADTSRRRTMPTVRVRFVRYSHLQATAYGSNWRRSNRVTVIGIAITIGASGGRSASWYGTTLTVFVWRIVR